MIDAFETIIKERSWSKNQIHTIMENIDSRLRSRLPEGTELELTSFQQMAIHSEGFWRDWSESKPRHQMVQAATSAGKTLVSELSILDSLQHDKKAIVLVPLKAMVNERLKQFRDDMQLGYYQVYGASSDYMEYDERLINGDYSVAIIVYEKFFAMLSQGPSRLMEDCGLLVVDELSMLSQEQRGPKLEIALEIVREKWPDTRIMALATCDCSTNTICRWLDIQNPIYSSARPVALEEHIALLNGEEIWRYIPQDYEPTVTATPLVKHENHIEVKNYRADWRVPEKKKHLLLAVLGEIFRKQPDSRLLVFVKSHADAVSVATYLQAQALEYFPSVCTKKGYQAFIDQVKQCEEDEDQQRLLMNLLPYGIAYHHSGVSTNLRELIEGEFTKNESTIKVIVATETLTVGVNMPFDAMIMMTNKVPRGKSDPEPLSLQEYRNYIGRAGRLGQKCGVGTTYLFVENVRDQESYWNSFYNREEICSALLKSDEERLAPYYLSLLSNHIGRQKMDTGFSKKDLEMLHERSLSRISQSATEKAPSIGFDKLADSMYNAYLINKDEGDDPYQSLRGREKTDEKPSYQLSDFGLLMAPYALSTVTSQKINTFFNEGYQYGGLPLELTKEDLMSDRYLLDILEHVCSHAEIVASSNLNFPERNSEKYGPAKFAVMKQLRKIFDETDSNGKKRYSLMYEVQENGKKFEKSNHLWSIMNGEYPSEEDLKLKSASRAILLFYWTKGYQVKDIAKISGFTPYIKIIAGDLERLAEVVSFHLDAIYKVCRNVVDKKTFRKAFEDRDAHSAFYSLQTRVKYGMPRDLVVLANKHIHGLDRKRLIELRKEAEIRGLTPTEFVVLAPTETVLHYLTPTQYKQLKQAVLCHPQAGDSERELMIHCNLISKDIGQTEGQNLEALIKWNRVSDQDFFESLRTIVSMDLFKSVSLSTDGVYDKILWNCGDRRIRMAVLTADHDRQSDVGSRFREFFDRDPKATPLLLVPHSTAPEDQERIRRESGAKAVLDHIYFAYQLASYIQLSSRRRDCEALTQMLRDFRGTFTSIVDQNRLPRYMGRELAENCEPKYRLLLGFHNDVYGAAFDADALEAALSQDPELKNYELLSCGEQLYSETESFRELPTILMLDRKSVTSSESLNRFVALMRQQRFHNCLLLLTSNDEIEVWDSDEEGLEKNGANRWNEQYRRISRVVVSSTEEAKQKIKKFLHEWKKKDYLIGISYAHYEPTMSEKGKSDNEKLEKLAQKLAERYGEDRILYDRLPSSEKLFYENHGLKRSLEAYQSCKLHLVLWNYWAKINENCIKERKIIADRVASGNATAILLQQGHADDPGLQAESWMEDFCVFQIDDSNLMNAIEQKLGDMRD